MQQTGKTSPTPDSHFTDFATRTHYILKELREVGLTGQKVDFLYVSIVIYFSSSKLTLP